MSPHVCVGSASSRHERREREIEKERERNKEREKERERERERGRESFNATTLNSIIKLMLKKTKRNSINCNNQKIIYSY